MKVAHNNKIFSFTANVPILFYANTCCRKIKNTPSINLNNMTFRKKFELSKKKYIIRMAMYTKNKAFVV